VLVQRKMGKPMKTAIAEDNFGEGTQLVGISVLSVIVASFTVTPVTVMLRLAAASMNAIAIVSLLTLSPTSSPKVFARETLAN